MKVSVAMATYNGELFLEEQLRSLAEQHRLPDEVVVTDDGSRDATVALLHRFAKLAPFEMRIVENESRLGFAQNFSKSLSLCSGDVVLPCDQDDYWFKDKIAVMLKVMKDSPALALVICDTALADETLNPIGLSKMDVIRKHGLPDQAHVMGCCMAIRSQFLRLALPIPGIQAHDNWIAQLADELGISKRLEKELLFHRLHSSNTSNHFVNKMHTQSAFQKFTFTVQRMAAKISSGGGIDNERGVLLETIARLDLVKEEFNNMVGADRVRQARSMLGKRLATVNERIAIRDKPRSARLVPIIMLWRAGGYRTRWGIAGAAKDALLSSPTHRKE